MKQLVTPTRRSLIKGLAATSLVGSVAGPVWAAKPARPVVVELFTSQGCNVCPPSEKVLADLAKRPNVIAIGLHVDYWDFLGWKDTLADPSHAKRQSAYNMALRRRSNFTPQMIIDGAVSVSGAREDKVNRIIRRRKERQNDPVPVTLTLEGGTLRIDLGEAPDALSGQRCTVHVVPFRSRRKIVIERGENAGRELKYTNSVRDLTRLEDWTGIAATQNYPLDAATLEDLGGIAVIVQDAESYEVVGAAQLLFDS